MYANATFGFVDFAGLDFHLSGTDTGARRRGAVLRNDPDIPFDDDIDGDPRTSATIPWDIGADQSP